MEIRRRETISAFQDDALHPVLLRVLQQRNINDTGELDYSLAALATPADMLHVRDAAQLLQAHRNGHILIVGDFDADGATSTALAMLALRAMGFAKVEFLVPDRFRFGYGLTPEIVALAQAREPSLIVTVDNGISSMAGVAAARAAGIDVLITDHHLPGHVLPDANVIVNPNQPGDRFAGKSLAGVGVMFYVLLALRQYLREQELPGGDCNLAQWLDLVALGTVADIVPLDANNRRLVYQGLRRIRAGACRPGILALLSLARRNRETLCAADLGFALGPRLNAAGRLDDMSIGIECLLADDERVAMRLAEQLDQLNRERRDIEQQMQEQALASIDALKFDADLPIALCLFDESWHQGVVGLVASRIKDRTHRPVIAFAANDEFTLKGSARSIEGLHIRDALDAIATRYPGLIEKFGGHAMAAGLSLPRASLDRFRAAFEDEVARHMDVAELTGVIESDGALETEYHSLDVAELLRAAGPWGQHFPEPQFDGQFAVVEQRIIGERHLKLRLALPEARQVFDAIAFNHGSDLLETERVHAVYRLDINEWQGRRSVQLLIEYLDPVGE